MIVCQTSPTTQLTSPPQVIAPYNTYNELESVTAKVTKVKGEEMTPTTPAAVQEAKSPPATDESKAQDIFTVLFTPDTAWYPTYVRTRHKNLRCFPCCLQEHKERSFCGLPLRVTLRKTGPNGSKPASSFDPILLGAFRRKTDSPLVAVGECAKDAISRVDGSDNLILAMRKSNSTRRVFQQSEGPVVVADASYIFQPRRKWQYGNKRSTLKSEPGQELPPELMEEQAGRSDLPPANNSPLIRSPRSSDDDQHAFTAYVIHPETKRCLAVQDSPYFGIVSAWKQSASTVLRPYVPHHDHPSALSMDQGRLSRKRSLPGFGDLGNPGRSKAAMLSQLVSPHSAALASGMPAFGMEGHQLPSDFLAQRQQAALHEALLRLQMARRPELPLQMAYEERLKLMERMSAQNQMGMAAQSQRAQLGLSGLGGRALNAHKGIAMPGNPSSGLPNLQQRMQPMGAEAFLEQSRAQGLQMPNTEGADPRITGALFDLLLKQRMQQGGSPQSAIQSLLQQHQTSQLQGSSGSNSNALAQAVLALTGQHGLRQLDPKLR